MPGHIYIRTGDYAGAVRANQDASSVDRQYIDKFHVTGMYPAMYYNHNLHFLAIAAAMEGRFTEANNAATQLVGNVAPLLKDIPMVEAFLPTRMLVLVRFHRWDEVLKLPEPDAAALTARALFHFGRGMAFAQNNKTYEADYERRALIAAANYVPEESTFGFNRSRDILNLSLHLLEGHISLARVAIPAAVEHFQKAAQIEDSLRYDEPPDWYIPPRESLGRAQMIGNQYDAAEKVFRTELDHHPRSGRALYGLWQCLKAEGKKPEAKQAELEYRAAWKNADAKLSVDDL
jgi:tetratricopeptide (TPR) repeat protein